MKWLFKNAVINILLIILVRYVFQVNIYFDFRFIETKKSDELKIKPNPMITKNNPKVFNVTSHSMNKNFFYVSNVSRDGDSLRYGSYSKGPVVKLPVQPKIIMRVENTCASRPKHPTTQKPQPNPNTSHKITAVSTVMLYKNRNSTFLKH